MKNNSIQRIIILIFLFYSISSTAQIDFSDETVQLSKANYTIPQPNLLGRGKINSISKLYGNDGDPFPYLPHLFIHKQKEGSNNVPENEFIIKSYYHPAIIVDNINTESQSDAEGGTNLINGKGWQTSLLFRRKSKAAWQISSDYQNNGNMGFSIRQWDEFAPFGSNTNSTERFIINPVYDVSQIGIGENTNTSSWQNFINGNTHIRGYLNIKSLNSSNGTAAIGMETRGNGNAGDGNKTWIRLANTHDIEFSRNRSGNDITYWAFREDGSISNDSNNLTFRGVNAQMTTLNNDNSNNLRLIMGANENETFLKQNYSLTSRPFSFYVGNGKVMTLSTTDNYKLTVHGNALATVWQTSDKRFKKNINSINKAIDKISEINGVSYNYKNNQFKNRKFNTGRTYGFIAQELKKTFPELVMEDKEGYLAVNYTGLTPIIVEAVKELKNENELLKNEINTLKEKLKNVLDNFETTYNNDFVNKDNVILYQNTPNPFKNDTFIKYSIPINSRNTSLYIFNLNGNLLLEFNNLKGGNKYIKINGGDLQAGLYIYKLISDGKEIGTKKMILSK
ncbi:tail fiber domain-containing protein [Aquimarina sp. MMG015]|uniref:tail fiber domain-containing protein n=1 Tax=Aquimarina sp. MMG015 TaxID=2822689 RepID=UPI001B3A3FD0|nr:tail fiber domain-containing protein [Aquimarina sp. MMG015]MBQ4804532.1 tail fiber domain-containing protein [Aquimarina sp. MMG015]